MTFFIYPLAKSIYSIADTKNNTDNRNMLSIYLKSCIYIYIYIYMYVCMYVYAVNLSEKPYIYLFIYLSY